MSVKSYSGDVRYPLGVVALVVTALVLNLGVELALNSYAETGSTWLPTVGSIGSTTSIYLLVTNAITVLLVPAVAFYLGHRHGQQTR